MAGIYVHYNLSVPSSNYTNNYPRRRSSIPGQHFAFLVWPPVYLTRNWPVEVAIEDASRGQWGEMVHRLREGCMKFSPATQQKFIPVKSKAVCDQKPRAFDRELSLKQSQSPTGLADDRALVRAQIPEFKSVTVALATAENSSNPDRAARDRH